jgi:DNA adenine methylase
LFEFTSNLLSHNHLNHGHYAEPFAGGCGLALALLYAGQVAEISINDVDPSIWAFWDSVLNRTGDLISLIEETPVSIEEWHR